MGRYPGGTIVRVTPTLTTDAYSVGDALFLATKIPGAVSNRGGVSYLSAMYFLDKSDNSDGNTDIIFGFQEKEGTTIASGGINTSVDISNSDLANNKVLGYARSIGDNATTAAHIDNARIHMVFPAGGVNENAGPNLMLKADAGSTDVYVWAVLEASTPTYAVDSLELIFHIKYLE